MQALSTERFYTKDQLTQDENKQDVPKEGAEGYKIKPLNSLQFCEVMTDGFTHRNGEFVMSFAGVKLLLRYGLDDPTIISTLPALKLTEIATGIYHKSAVAEAERKN
jgi:hypothetical protein